VLDVLDIYSFSSVNTGAYCFDEKCHADKAFHVSLSMDLGTVILSFSTIMAPSSRYNSNVISSLRCSVFGEDALVNVSVEKKEDNDGKLAGYIRIRSKTQGIALSLGDRITSVQRAIPQKQ